MEIPIVHSSGPILLVGGALDKPEAILPWLGMVNAIVAADGGADAVLAAGAQPDAVIGDMDSLSAVARSVIPDAKMHPVTEQDSTDFDKALRHVSAPLVIGLGFLGARVDHELAAMTVLARHADRRCILLGSEDLVMLCPPRLALDLPAGTRVSLFPLGPVTGRSTGLRWPLDGLEFAPALRGGTSNEAVGGPVEIATDQPLMLLILPLSCLGPVRSALASQPASWPARA